MSSPNHGGARPNAGRPKAPYTLTKVNIKLPQPLVEAWDAHCAATDQSRPQSLAQWLKWKKPKRAKS
jgi:hypothetical protein